MAAEHRGKNSSEIFKNMLLIICLSIALLRYKINGSSWKENKNMVSSLFRCWRKWEAYC